MESKYFGKGTRYLRFSLNERGWNTLLSIELKINLEITLGPRVNECIVFGAIINY